MEAEEEEEEVKAGRIADVRMSCRRRRESRQEVKTRGQGEVEEAGPLFSHRKKLPSEENGK